METIKTHTGKIYVDKEKKLEFLTVGDYGKKIEDIRKDKSELIKEFEKLSQPLIGFINTNYHPHCTAIIDSSHAELTEGLIGYSSINSKPE